MAGSGTSVEPPGSKRETVAILGALAAFVALFLGSLWFIAWLFG